MDTNTGLLHFGEPGNKPDNIKHSSGESIIKELTGIMELNDFPMFSRRIREIGRSFSAMKDTYLKGGSDGFDVSGINQDIDQILEAFTLECSKYYLRRLIRGLTSTREGKLNNMNLNRWKEYSNIITDSLWILERRDRNGEHNAGYWGNFVPQIPNQLLNRFTKKGEWVPDVFLGGGTTIIESRRLGRNSIGIDLSPEVVKLASENISKEGDPFNVRAEIINADSTTLDYHEVLRRIGTQSVQLVIMHPPYWDIVKFSENESDLANAASLEGFRNGIRTCMEKIYKILDGGRYFALVVGDKYSKGEWIPPGLYAMNEALKIGYRLKSVVVKNFDVTKGKKRQAELWRYRTPVGGFYVFKGE